MKWNIVLNVMLSCWGIWATDAAQPSQNDSIQGREEGIWAIGYYSLLSVICDCNDGITLTHNKELKPPNTT